MKSISKSSLRALSLALFAVVAASTANASDLMKDFDTLGGNDVLLEKARSLNPEATITVVQDRVVSRRKRVEIAPEYTNVMGGDAYNKTQTFGLNAHYHFTPRWSIGAKYEYALNELKPEATNLIHSRDVSDKAIIPDIDFPKSQMLATVNWYPIYGKMNLYDLGVAHFDIYTLLGAGQVQLKSGSSATYTAGGGVGFWISQHLTTRFELRYQNYNSKRYTGTEPMNLTVAGLQIGYLL